MPRNAMTAHRPMQSGPAPASGAGRCVSGLRAIDGTPILDVKPVLGSIEER
jgi:hypothetical protein